MTAIFGILNITEDSFSDGGKFLDPAAAETQARWLMTKGAQALDLGAASSNPNSKPVAPEVEIARLAPVVALARKEGWPVSIDSFARETQEWAAHEGVAYINDIRGFPDTQVYPALARASAKLIVMHSVQEGPATIRVHTDPATIVKRILDYFRARVAALEDAGIARERLILDPGMGAFLGSDPEVSRMVLRRLSELKSAFGLPILVSLSRKGFLRKLTNRPVGEIGPATLTAELFAVERGADMIRTHDPGALKDALRTQKWLNSGI
jgi:dihydropteroate synthase type 2